LQFAGLAWPLKSAGDFIAILLENDGLFSAACRAGNRNMPSAYNIGGLVSSTGGRARKYKQSENARCERTSFVNLH
jgi:hypothetical protein